MFLFPSQKKPNTQETNVKQEDIIYQVISVQLWAWIHRAGQSEGTLSCMFCDGYLQKG